MSGKTMQTLKELIALRHAFEEQKIRDRKNEAQKPPRELHQVEYNGCVCRLTDAELNALNQGKTLPKKTRK